MTMFQIERYLQERKLHRVDVSDDELVGAWSKAVRALRDTQTVGLSDEGSFLRAYEGAFLLATAAIQAAGYRLRGAAEGHHYDTFYILKHLGVADLVPFGPRLEAKRRLRSMALYDLASGVSSRDAGDMQAIFEELLAAVRQELLRIRPQLEDQLVPPAPQLRLDAPPSEQRPHPRVRPKKSER